MESLHQLAEAALGPCRRLCSRCTAPLVHAVWLPLFTLYSSPRSRCTAPLAHAVWLPLLICLARVTRLQFQRQAELN